MVKTKQKCNCFLQECNLKHYITPPLSFITYVISINMKALLFDPINYIESTGLEERPSGVYR